MWLLAHFDSPLRFCDPETVRWCVSQDVTGAFPFQQGRLEKFKSVYGSYNELYRPKDDNDSDLNKLEILKIYPNEVQMRDFFWKLACHWHKRYPELHIGVRGSWTVWSHFFHRMIHDDFTTRRDAAFPIVVDLDMVDVGKKLDLFNTNSIAHS